MQLSTEWIEYTSDGEAVTGYLTRPSGVREQLPAVIVIQEVWGPDAHICDLADRFATAGYIALAPDLYSHGGRPAELEPERITQAKALLDSLPPAAWSDESKRDQALAELPAERARETRETLAALLAPGRPIERYLSDLRAALGRLRHDPDCDGRVAAVGFCLGGGLSSMLACAEPSLAAAVVFYGSSPPAERIADIGCPVLGLYGERDERILAGVPAFASAMQAAGKDFESVVYSGAAHAFFNDTRHAYRPAAARDAWARTLGLLARVAPAPTVTSGAGT